jgi:ATP-binding cassette subfamily F protein 3
MFAAFSMLTLSQLSKSFAGRTLFSDVSLQVNRGDRIGLVGPNGAGKSTLFSLILGEASPDNGRVVLERSASMGFLPQESAPAGDETVLELACAISPEMTKAQGIIKRYESAHSENGQGAEHAPSDEEYHDALATFDELGGWQLEPKAKQILHGLAFRESDFDRMARTMSGGWIMRAHLARLLVMEPDLLLLDEPTNHLDLESLYWFQDYLGSYPGAILMISHDREFLNPLPRQLGQIRAGKGRARRAAPRRLQEPAKGNRFAPGICRSLPRQGQQGLAGAEQTQADRSHGKDRGAGEPGENRPHALSAAAAVGHPGHRDEGHRFLLR